MQKKFYIIIVFLIFNLFNLFNLYSKDDIKLYEIIEKNDYELFLEEMNFDVKMSIDTLYNLFSNYDNNNLLNKTKISDYYFSGDFNLTAEVYSVFYTSYKYKLLFWIDCLIKNINPTEMKVDESVFVNNKNNQILHDHKITLINPHKKKQDSWKFEESKINESEFREIEILFNEWKIKYKNFDLVEIRRNKFFPLINSKFNLGTNNIIHFMKSDLNSCLQINSINAFLNIVEFDFPNAIDSLINFFKKKPVIDYFNNYYLNKNWDCFDYDLSIKSSSRMVNLIGSHKIQTIYWIDCILRENYFLDSTLQKGLFLGDKLICDYKLFGEFVNIISHYKLILSFEKNLTEDLNLFEKLIEKWYLKYKEIGFEEIKKRKIYPLENTEFEFKEIKCK